MDHGAIKQKNFKAWKIVKRIFNADTKWYLLRPIIKTITYSVSFDAVGKPPAQVRLNVRRSQHNLFLFFFIDIWQILFFLGCCLTLFWSAGYQGSFCRCMSKSVICSKSFSRKISIWYLLSKPVMPIMTYNHSMLQRTAYKRRVDVRLITTQFAYFPFLIVDNGYLSSSMLT